MRTKMNSVLLKSVACLLLLFSFTVQATSLCQDYFLYKMGLSHLDSEHLKAIGRYQTRDGHVIYYEELSKPDKIKEANRVDPHGFISNARHIFGEMAASFWGSVQVGLYYSFGDIDFINTRISRYNQKASSMKQIPVRFEIDSSETSKNTANNTSPDELYVRKHAKLIALIGRSGWIRKHDENYHVFANIYVPRSFHLEAQKKSQILIQFIDFLEQRGLRDDETSAMIEAMLHHRAIDIDLMANAHVAMVFTYGSADHKKEYIDLMLSRKHSDLTNYTQAHLTAADFLKRIVLKYRPTKISEKFFERYLNIFFESLPDETLAVYLRSEMLGLTESDLASMTFDNFIHLKGLSSRLAPQLEPIPDLHL